MDNLFKKDEKLILISSRSNKPFTQYEKIQIKKEIGFGIRSGFFHRRKFSCVFTFIDGVYNVILTYRETGKEKCGRFFLIKVSEK